MRKEKASVMLILGLISVLGLSMPTYATTSTHDYPALVQEDAETGEETKVETYADGKIMRVDVQSGENLPAEGGEVTVQMMVTKNTPNSLIKASAFSGDEKIELSDINVSGDEAKARRILKFTVPANQSTEEKTYTLKFNCTGSDDVFDAAHILTIKIAGKEVKESPVIESTRVDKPELPKEGGTARFTVKGSNLDNGMLKYKLYKLGNGEEKEKAELLKGVKFLGTEKVKTALITFPPVNEGVEEYVLKLGFDGDMSHSIGIKVGEKSSNELTVINPSNVYIDSSLKIITLKFDEEIFMHGTEEDLRKAVEISENGTDFSKLGEEDRVKVEADKMTVSLKNEINVGSTSRIKLKERAIRDKNNNDNKEFSFFIKKSSPVVEKAEFLEGETLDSKGGRVKLKITGLNLERIKAKTSKNEKLHLKADDIEVNIEDDAEGAKILSFDLPENKTERVQTYTVQVSLDGGRTYKSDLAASVYDRTKRLVCAVLPEGADPTKPALSFMSIQSYGTSGGSKELPDITYTNTPTNQESKKTFVYVYGVNLDSKLTKVKIVDKNGIEWTPVNDSTSDSFDQFIMIGFDHTGIAGNGNNQMLEIICPNNMKGDNEFKYLIAVDGKNYDTEVFVTANVIDDKTGSKRDMSVDKIKTVKVNFVDRQGKAISEAFYAKGYVWNKLVSYNINPVKIDEYEQIEYKIAKKEGNEYTWTAKNALEYFDALRLSDADEVSFVYANVDGKDLQPDNQTPDTKPEIKPDTKPEIKPEVNNRVYSGGSSGSGGGSRSVRSTSVKSVNRETKKGTWQKDAKGWWYRFEDGTWPAGKWLSIEYEKRPQWFYFNESGYMATSWIKWQEKWYYLDKSGAMLTNTMTPDGYKVNAQGVWAE